MKSAISLPAPRAGTDKDTVLAVFEALSSAMRLDIFCLLVHAGGEGRVAGELARDLGLPATNLSFHLKMMLKAGLVTVQPEGRFQRYRANTPHMLRVLAFLTENCAAGTVDGCTVRARPARPAAPKRKARPAAAA